MNARNRFLVKGAIAIVLLWAVVGGVVRIAGSMKPTAVKVAKYAQSHPLDEIEDQNERKVVIGRLAEMLNQMEPTELRKLEEMGERRERRRMFESMTPDEQWFFMEKRMGRAFSQMMQVFNEMDRAERRKTVERAVREIRRSESSRANGGGSGGPSFKDADREMVEKIASAGMEAYFRDASAETKLDLAPVMEEMQKLLSAPGRGFHSRRGTKK